MVRRKGGKGLWTMWRESCQRQLLFHCDAISAQLRIPGISGGKKIEKPNNCWRTEVKQTKYWSTFPEMDFSKLFIWSFELLEGEKAEKSLQLTHSGLLSPVVKRYRIYLTTITHLTSKTWFHQCLIWFFFQNVWLYIWNSIRKWGLRFESNNSSETDAPQTVLVLPIWTDNQEKVLCSLKQLSIRMRSWDCKKTSFSTHSKKNP